MARGRTLAAPETGMLRANPTEWEYQYYRLPNGWIDASPVGKGRFHQMSRMAEGWEPLPEYGGFEWTEYSCSNPLETLFIRGGAREVCLEQILANGWQQHPPLIPGCDGLTVDKKGQPAHKVHGAHCWRNRRAVEFPQLAGLTLPELQACEFCGREDFPSSKARDKHLRAMHKEELIQLRMGEATAKAIAEALERMGVKPAPFACGLCKDAFETGDDLIAHVAKHSEPTPASGRTRKEVNTDGDH